MKPIDFARLIENTTDVADKLNQSICKSGWRTPPDLAVDLLVNKMQKKRRWSRYPWSRSAVFKSEIMARNIFLVKIPTSDLRPHLEFTGYTGTAAEREVEKQKAAIANDPWLTLALSSKNRENMHLKLLREFQKIDPLMRVHRVTTSTRVEMYLASLSKHPVISITKLATEAKVTRVTAKKWLLALVDLGVLQVAFIKGMNQFAYLAILEIIDEFLLDEYCARQIEINKIYSAMPYRRSPASPSPGTM